MVKGNITFTLTEDQAKQICGYYNADFESCDETEICEMLDQLIDETTI